MSAYRAFTSTSPVNQKAPAKVHPDSDAIIAWILADPKVTNYVHLAGLDATGKWGVPVYWASPSDPIRVIKAAPGAYALPPEFAAVRIPDGAHADPTPDGSMTVYDLNSGTVIWVWKAVPDGKNWMASGGSIHYLASNGLDKLWKTYAGWDKRNRGHRGVPGSTFPVRWDELQAGVIEHFLKIAVHVTKASNVFPMTGNENGSSEKYAPDEGLRIVIKPSVDVTKKGLKPMALTIAHALQDYGAIIGDQSGGPVSLPMENLVAEGRGWLWSGNLDATSLKAIPLTDYQILAVV
jgi:hypothetical protein